MNFSEIAEKRQSCRSYDSAREVETEKLEAILSTARLVITLGYAKADDPLRPKKRKPLTDLVQYLG